MEITPLATVQKSPRVGDQIPNKINLFKLRLGVITPIALYFKPDTPNLPDAEIARRFSELVKHLTQQQMSEPSPEGNASTGNGTPIVN
jgi:hypothetical protein